MTTQVYTDPSTPGAPQVGDVVVVAVDGGPGYEWETRLVGEIGVLRYISPPPVGHRWYVGNMPVVHAVRRPTEAELATWALQEHGGAP